MGKKNIPGIQRHTETVTRTTSTTNNLHVIWLYGTGGVVDSSNVKISCSVHSIYLNICLFLKNIYIHTSDIYIFIHRDIYMYNSMVVLSSVRTHCSVPLLWGSPSQLHVFFVVVPTKRNTPSIKKKLKNILNYYEANIHWNALTSVCIQLNIALLRYKTDSVNQILYTE